MTLVALDLEFQDYYYASRDKKIRVTKEVGIVKREVTWDKRPSFARDTLEGKDGR